VRDTQLVAGEDAEAGVFVKDAAVWTATPVNAARTPNV
jgi:hypothetical protein